MQLSERGRATRERDLIFSQINGLGLLGAARTLYRLAIEKEKTDAERVSGYQQRDWARIEGGLTELQKRFQADMERKLMGYWFSQYLKLPADQRVAALDAWIGTPEVAAVDRKLDALYAGTKLKTLAERLGWLNADRKKIEASGDAMIALAVAVMPTVLALEDEGRAVAGDYSRYRPLFLSAVQDYRRSLGGHVYPDANASLRVTYGHVVGYQPRDGIAAVPFTTAEGMAAKATPDEPFNAPADLLAAIRAKRYGAYVDPSLGTLPVNFLADLDITGGNSGSPVMNAKGELVGLVFDGTWEGVSANWVYDGMVNRAIALDVRYLLWYMDLVNPAPRLLKEMGSVGHQ